MKRLAPFVPALMLLIAVFVGPAVAPFDPSQTNIGPVMEPPGATHWLGTDGLGRDVLSRVLHGGRRTLLIAGVATIISVLVGLALGLSAGRPGSIRDQGVLLIVNTLLAIPGLMLALVVMTLLGQGAWQLAFATGCAHIALYAQVARTVIRGVRAEPYIEGAQAVGATGGRILLRYILPNAAPVLLGYVGVIFSYSILNSAALSFLGLGTPGLPDWGVILAEGRTVFRTAPWVSVAPGLLILLLVMSVNAVADRIAVSR